MRGISVPGGKQDETPGTLSRWFRARWEADETPGTLSQEYRGRWEAGKDTWNAFAGKPWQVDDREETPDMLSQENRGRWTVGKATWNAFAGIPCQVGGGKGYLERFRGNSVPGGRRERLPGTLSREFRARWEAEKDTWNTFAGKPWQVGGGKGHLEHFRRKTVAGGDTSVHVGRDILWRSAGPSRNAGPFPSREPMPASAIVCPCHFAFCWP